MKILGFYITRTNYASILCDKNAEIGSLHKFADRKVKECEEAHVSYSTIKQNYDELHRLYKESLDTVFVREEDIKELRSRLEDTKSSNTELSERLEKEMSDNCELQNLYSEKCKECDEAKAHAIKLADSYNRIAGEKADLEAAKKAAEDKFEKYYGLYEREGYVVVKEDFYSQVLTDAEKFREEREKHNANRRKRRAAKKVAQGKPDN